MATRRDLFEIEEQVPRGTLVYLSPDRIEPNPRQPRQHVSRAGLEELKASIAARGILHALLGTRGAGGRVTLVAGHRRWQAAKELKLARVPIILVENRGSGTDPIIDAIIENVQRENLAPWEEGESYRQLASEFGWDHKQIAATIGKSRPYVTQRIRAAENLASVVKEFFLTGDEYVLNLDQNGVEKARIKSENVTAVTPGEENHNDGVISTENNLAAFLNNVELVRRLTALTPALQIAAVKEGVQLARQQDRTLSLTDLTNILKNYRDQTPSPKARSKLKQTAGESEQDYQQLKLDFDLSELQVVRWSVQEKKPDWQAEEVDRLIARYEDDLERLRRWRDQRVGEIRPGRN